LAAPIIPNELVQKPPKFVPVTVEKEKVEQNISEIFRTIRGYKIPFFTYGMPIVGLILIGIVVSFSLYFHMWMISDSGKGTSIFYLFYKLDFWAGLVLLLFFCLLYPLSFSTYLGMLYDSRLSDLVNILTSDSPLATKYMKLHESKFRAIYDPSNVRNDDNMMTINGKKISKLNIGGFEFKTSPGISIPGKIPESRSKQMEREAYKVKNTSLVDLLQIASIKIDGVTIRGYFLPLLLLQIIVAGTFVLPVTEFVRSGNIGTNIMLLPPLKNSQYISFWVIEWSVFGAFVYSFVNLMERIPRKDVMPRFYLNVALRYIFAIALSSLIYLIFSQPISGSAIKPFSEGVFAAVSFTVGMFPNRYFRTITSFVDTRLTSSSSRDIPLEKLPDISSNEVTRLWEEGIDNINQLADSSVQSLYVRTRYNPIRLKDLVGKAILWKYVFSTGELLAAFNLEKRKYKDKVANTARKSLEIEKFNKTNSMCIPNIQSLCSLVYCKSFDDIKVTDIKTAMKNLPSVAEQISVDEYRLKQIALLTKKFQEQLSFQETTKEIANILKEITKAS
jgi:hypothetical protein